MENFPHPRLLNPTQPILRLKKVPGFGFLIILMAATLLLPAISASLPLVQTGPFSNSNPKGSAPDYFQNLPLYFTPSLGLSGPSVNFMAKGKGYSLALEPTQATFSLLNEQAATPVETYLPQPGTTETPSAPVKSEVGVRMQLIGANPHAQATGLDKQSARTNLFIGNDPAKWRTNIPDYAGVKYQGIYPGTDLVYYGNNGQLEYDFQLAPGADPTTINLAFTGITGLAVDEQGELTLTIPGQVKSLVFQAPRTYQEIKGKRQYISSRYHLDKRGGTNEPATVSFELGDYNRAAPLTIDPALVYSTFLGGTQDDYGRGISIDGSGNTFITGQTGSANFPLKNASQNTYGGKYDAFIAKFDSSGGLVFSTYFGGSGDDAGYSLGLDSSGNIFICGWTSSANFPVKNAYQNTYGGGSKDAFVAKFDSSGSLLYSTYLGGSGDESGYGLGLDSSGNAYLAGYTTSTDFPAKNAYQGTYGGGIEDAFVTKFDNSGGLLYSTFFGGKASDFGDSIGVDSGGNAFITGVTFSTNFPVKNAYEASLHGADGVDSDAFIAGFNSSGGLLYSTYFGDSGKDYGYGITVDSSGNVYFTGATGSTNFPLKNAYQSVYGGNYDAFIAKLDSSGSLAFSTFLGGSGGDTGYAIRVDSSGNIYVTGATGSTNFPSKNGYQATPGGKEDAFISKFNGSDNLLYSTYLGGSGNDESDSIAVDSSGNTYITGNTASNNFPTQNAYQPSIGSSQTTDAFLTKLATGATKTCTVNTTSDDAATNGSFRNALLESPKCDIINFNFAGPSTINILNTPLPEVPTDVIINGLCNNNQPIITISGTGINGAGLYLSGGDSVDCLEVQHFSGIQLQAVSGSARNILDHIKLNAQ